MDNYYCLIRLHKNAIVLNLIQNKNHYINIKSMLPICFSASSASILYRLVIMHKLFHNLSIVHIMYLSQEIYKAELAIFLNQKYIQS